MEANLQRWKAYIKDYKSPFSALHIPTKWQEIFIIKSPELVATMFPVEKTQESFLQMLKRGSMSTVALRRSDSQAGDWLEP